MFLYGFLVTVIGHIYSSDNFLTELFCAKSFTYNVYTSWWPVLILPI